MSTRAVIARKTGPKTWRGVYHHWDGCPSRLGRYLWEHLQPRASLDILSGSQRNGGMLEAALSSVIDKHPRGWSTLMDLIPKCFCHSMGEGIEGDPELDHSTAAGCGCEYAYVFDTENQTMEVLSSYTPKGEKMIGAFGSGDPASEWRRIAMIDLTVPESPDWGSM